MFQRNTLEYDPDALIAYASERFYFRNKVSIFVLKKYKTMDKEALILEGEIANFVGTSNGCSVHFEHTADGPGIVHQAIAYTFNPTSKETFLLKSVIGGSKHEALEQILEYVKTQKGQNSFTVIWMKVGDSQSHTSYFYCHDILDVVHKFFHNKNSKDYVIYEIKLNPIA